MSMAKSVTFRQQLIVWENSGAKLMKRQLVLDAVILSATVLLWLKNELAGVFKMFKSKIASWKQMDAFFKLKTNQRNSYVRQALPASRWHPEEEVKKAAFCVFSALHHPILLHHSSPFISIQLSTQSRNLCVLEEGYKNYEHIKTT